MRPAAAILAACVGLGLTACGGGETTTATTGSTTSTSTSTGATGAAAAEGEPIEELVANAAGVAPEEVQCGDEGGLESVIGSAGTCSAAGTEYVVADHGEDLELDTLTARVEAVQETARVSGNYLKPKQSKRGRFVVGTLAITNEGSREEVFDDFGEQAQLVAGTDTYREPFSMLNGVATGSFLWKASKIKPGRTASGDVVFDVPEPAVAELGTNASIQILNFGDEGNIKRADQIGLLRTGEPKGV